MFASIKSHATNFGIIFYSDLKFGHQINTVIKNSFFQLRRFAKLKSVLSKNDLEKAIHGFISSRLDYCKALHAGGCQSSLSS